MIFGIHLGRLNTTYAFLDGSHPPVAIDDATEGGATPSVVLFDRAGVLVGASALRAADLVGAAPARRLDRSHLAAVPNGDWPMEALAVALVRKGLRDLRARFAVLPDLAVAVPDALADEACERLRAGLERATGLAVTLVPDALAAMALAAAPAEARLALVCYFDDDALLLARAERRPDAWQATTVRSVPAISPVAWRTLMATQVLETPGLATDSAANELFWSGLEQADWGLVEAHHVALLGDGAWRRAPLVPSHQRRELAFFARRLATEVAEFVPPSAAVGIDHVVVGGALARWLDVGAALAAAGIHAPVVPAGGDLAMGAAQFAFATKARAPGGTVSPSNLALRDPAEVAEMRLNV